MKITEKIMVFDRALYCSETILGNGKVRHVECLEADKAACAKAGWITEEIIGYVPTDASNLPLYGKMDQQY